MGHWRLPASGGQLFDALWRGVAAPVRQRGEAASPKKAALRTRSLCSRGGPMGPPLHSLVYRSYIIG